MSFFKTTPEEFLSEFITLLKGMYFTIDGKNIIYKEEFDKGTGVWEKYTLKEHVLLVLNQFLKYDSFDGTVLPSSIDRKSFMALLVLHDIGKPYAVENHSKKNQSTYNHIFIRDIMSRLKIKHIEIFSEIVKEDIIGGYIQGYHSLGDTLHRLGEHSKNCKTELQEFYNVMKIYYMCDAGAYTTDAGGKSSLDWLFVFDRNSRTISFSESVTAKMERLNKMVCRT